MWILDEYVVRAHKNNISNFYCCTYDYNKFMATICIAAIADRNKIIAVTDKMRRLSPYRKLDYDILIA